MRTKSWVLLALALGCGLVASVAISQVVLDQNKAAPPAATVDILVAVKDIDASGKLTADNVRLEKWPKDRVPVGAIIEFKEVEGKYANQSMFQGEPIVKKKLINSVDSLAYAVPKGYKIFDLAVNKDNNSEINYIKPGDKVDIFGFFEKNSRIPESKTVLIVENVTVKAVDGNAVRDNGEQGGKAIKSIQLLIRDSQYEAVNTATNLGKLRVALRPPSDDDQVSDEGANGSSFLNWIKSVEKTADSPTAGASPKQPVFDPLTLPPAPAKNENAGEMVVISPSSISKYRWQDETDMPELVTPDTKQNAVAPGGPMQSGTTQGNMVWNPNTGTWTTSGFSPSYPSADGMSSSKKKGEKESKESKGEKSE